MEKVSLVAAFAERDKVDCGGGQMRSGRGGGGARLYEVSHEILETRLCK